MKYLSKLFPLTALLAMALVYSQSAEQSQKAASPAPIPEAGVERAAAATPPIQILLPPVKRATGGWRISWTSEPGQVYQLQRWATDDLNVVGTPPWVDVANAVATGEITTLEDPGSIDSPRRFYRVVQLAEGSGDRTPPVVDPMVARFSADGGVPVAVLSVVAKDDVGVSRVTFFNGSRELGLGKPGASNSWSFVLPINPRELGARFLSARAVDAAGNVSNSPIFPLGLVDPDHFVPLGSDGQPVEGGIVQAVAAGEWGPVEYRPGGRNMFGSGPGFFLRFPNGVRLINQSGLQFLEFTNVVAGFGAQYPLQLAQRLERSSGPGRRIRVGPADLREVLGLFDLNPERGVEVRLFDRFPLRWQAGVVDDGGIRGARFGLVNSGLPLPGVSGDYPELLIDFTEKRGVRIPFYGEFELPDGTRTPFKLRAGVGSPIWLTLAPDGSVALAGSAEVLLPGGGRVRVDVGLTDPEYRLQLAAERVQLEALGSFAELLPGNPEICLPSTADAAQLGEATRCLNAFARAYLNFNASLAAMGDGTVINSAGSPADPVGTVSSVVEAWAFAALADRTRQLPLASIREAVKQLGRSAATAPSFEEVLRQKLALLRAVQAMQSGAAMGSAELSAELESALAGAETEAVRLAGSADAASSLENLTVAVRLIVEIEAVRQQTGRPQGTLITTALPLLMQRFADRYTAALGVQAGVLTPAGNATVSGMNRFVAAEHVRKLVEFLGQVQLLGVDLAGTRIDEALAQLGVRLFEVAAADALGAERRGDYPGFLLAFQDVLDIAAARQLAVFPSDPVLNNFLPGTAEVESFGRRLAVLLEQDLTKPLGERSFNNAQAELRALVRVMRQLPAGVTFASAAIRRVFDGMESALSRSINETALAGEGSPANLLLLLEAGTLHAELAGRFNLTAPVSWESVRLPLVVSRLASLATARAGWSEMNQGVRWLLNEGDRLGLAGDSAKRRVYLQQAAALLAGGRIIAGRLIQQAGPVVEAADLLLPGEIRVDQVAGSIRYNRFSGVVAGTLSGQLQLPKFGAALTIKNAALGNGGRFEIEAFGQMRVPEQSPQLTATVSSGDPLRLSWNSEDGVRLSGGAGFVLANGMSFKGSVGLIDPVYRFSLEAGGLEIGLLNAMLPKIPAPPAQADFRRNGLVDDTALGLWSSFYDSLNLAMDRLAPATAVGVGADADQNQPDDSRRTLLRAWGDLMAIGGHYGTMSNLTSTFQGAGELALNVRQAEALRLEQAGVNEGGLRAAATGTVTATAEEPVFIPSFFEVLQFDFGRPGDDFRNSAAAPVPPAAGQAHGAAARGTAGDFTLMPPDIGHWNTVDQFGPTRPLVFAEGSPATGISIDLGRTDGAFSGVVLTNREPDTFTLLDVEGTTGGVYSGPLMNDGLRATDPLTGQTDALAVRVLGLRPGYYYAVVMIGRRIHEARQDEILVGTDHRRVGEFETVKMRSPVELGSNPGWVEGVNYVLGRAAVSRPGDELVIVSRANPPADLRTELSGTSMISGLQILRPRVRLISFVAENPEVRTGGRIRLRWNVHHAETMTLEGSDGSVRQVSGGGIDLTAIQNTRYTLKVENRNGPVLQKSVEILVLDDETQRDNLRDLVTSSQNEDCDLAALVDECALRLQRGEECSEELERAAQISATNDLVIVNRLLNTNQCDRATMEDVEAAIGFISRRVGNRSTAGFADELLTERISDFATCVADREQRRAGLISVKKVRNQPDEVELDLPLISTFQISNTVPFIKRLVDFQASVTFAGGTLDLTPEFQSAHAENLLKRIREAVPAGTSVETLVKEKNFQELKLLIDAHETARFLFTNAGTVTTNAAVEQQVAASMDLVGAAMLARIDAEFVEFRDDLFALFRGRGFWAGQFDGILALDSLVKSGRAGMAGAVEERVRRVLEIIERESASDGHLTGREIEVLRFVKPYLDKPEFRIPYERRIIRGLEYISSRMPATRSWTPEEFANAPALLGELADWHLLIRSAREKGANLAIPEAVRVELMATRMILNAEEATRRSDSSGGINYSVEAVRSLNAFNRAIISNRSKLDTALADPNSRCAGLPRVSLLANEPAQPDTLAVALAGEWHRTIRLAGEAFEMRRRAVAAGSAGLLGDDLRLPAGFKVDRVFGEFHFNRVTGLMQGGFGGRVVLPQEGVVFDIRNASLASDGSFAIDAGTTTPLPFGRIGLTANLALRSTRSGGVDFSGDGEISVPVGNTNRTFAARLAYDQSSGQFSVNSTARNLDLRFSDDFVLFDAGFGFEVSQATPGGRFTALGSAGLFAKQKPLPALIDRSHFHLMADGITTSFAYENNGFTTRLENGTLRLPELFQQTVCPTGGLAQAGGPVLALSPGSPLTVVYRNAPQSAAFSGALSLANVGFQVPGFTNFAVEVCSATLAFPSNSLPELQNLNATVQLPVPGQTNRIDLVHANWSLTGLPTGLMRLRDDLQVFTNGGFALSMLGSGTNSAGTRLIVTNTTSGPVFELGGGIELAVPGSLLAGEDGSRLAGRAEGVVVIRPGRAPEFALGTLSIAATGGFRLGGTRDGLLVQNARLIAEGASNLFQLAPDRTFVLRLSGDVGIPNGPLLGLDNARFVFDGRGLPQFSFREARFSTQGELQLAENFPIQITSGSLRLKNQDAPFASLLQPTNLIVGLSATVNIPPGPRPVVSGEVEDLQLQLENGQLKPSVDGIGFGVSGLEIPPLSLAGRMFIGGLRSGATRAFAPAAVGPPNGIYFVGRLGGKFNGIGIIATVAMDLQGIIGVCMDAGLGPAGIPLDPTGFILTGASGGIAFGGTGGDPCEFTSFFPMDSAGKPVEGAPAQSRAAALRGSVRPQAVLSWDEYARLLDRSRREQAILDSAGARGLSVLDLQAAPARKLARQATGPVTAAAGETPSLDCPTGDCPPPSVNILAQPHPDAARFPNRIIFKFSSLDEEFLNGLGITESFVEGLGLTTPDGIAANISATVRDALRQLTPVADPALLGTDLARQLNALVESQLVEVQHALEDILRAAITPVIQDRGRVYDAIVEAAYAGIPFPGTTLSLHGTFSHVAVSTFLSGSVGVVNSGAVPIPNLPIPPGSSGITGTINLFGVPVGFGKAFLTTVDGRGAVNPSFCGDMLLAVGPLELGRGKMELKCDGCADAMLNTFGQLVNCLGQTTVNSILARVAPGKTVAGLTNDEKLGFLAHLFSQPPILELAPCFLGAARNSFEVLDPRFTYCADFRPRLFGLPLSASLVGIHATASKTGIAAAFNFSPTFLIGNLLLCASTSGQFCQPVFPALDNATFGFGFGFPDPTRLLTAGLEGRLNSPQALGGFVQQGFDSLLANATFTIGYEFSPFGLRALNSQARVVMPNLTAHPARPGFNYVRPEDRNAGLPSRRELILSALDRDLLKDPLWKGSAEDIHRAFADNTPEQLALKNKGLSFATDYFPHGGILGAARITLPRMLVDAPPAELGVLFAPVAPGNTALDKVTLGVRLIQEYVLSASDVGALAFYVPAPNPPSFVRPDGGPLSPADLLAGMQTFDPSRVAIGELYPLSQAILGGYVDGRLLGIPLARAQVEGVPADAARGVSAHFRLTSEIPAGSWLNSFVEGARMSFEIRQSPSLPIDQYFSNLVARAVSGTNSAQAIATEMANSISDAMPKVSLDLSIRNLRVPVELQSMLAPADASGRLVAFSPRFNPAFVGTNPVSLVTREGGIALQGSFRFANLVTVENAELAVSPKLSGPPRLAGDFNIPFVGFNNLGLHDARLIFNSEPGIRQPFLHVAGSVDPLRIGLPGQDPLVEIRPLVAGANRLSASLTALRASNGGISTAFSFSPSLARIPLFGPGVQVVVHGATTNDSFSFSTEGGWTNNITISGSIALRDPAGVEVLRFGDARQQLSGTLSCNGLAFQSIDLRLPASLQVTAFPGRGAPVEQVLQLGSATNQARLFVSADGRFEVSGTVGGPLSFPGFPVTGLSAGASFSMRPDGLTLGGLFEGGSIVRFVDRISGTMVLNLTGITSLNGEVLLDPVRFGNLVIEGANQSRIDARLTAGGLALASGARLRIEGLKSDVLRLAPFTNQANGDFTARLSVGNLNVPGSFKLESGNMELRKRGETVTLEIDAPKLSVFPGENFETRFESPLQRVVVESSGRFYADTSERELKLPGLIRATGRLEFGFEPDTRPASLQVPAGTISFGEQGIGLPSTRSLVLTNNGQAPLQISLSGTNRAFTVQPASFSLPPRTATSLVVTFLPTTTGPATNLFEIFSNAANGPHTVLITGIGRPQPIFSLSSTNINFGERAINSTVVRTLNIQNLGTAPFTLGSVELSPPFSLAAPVPSQTVAPRSNVTVSVRFSPSAVGSVSNIAIIRTNGTAIAGRVSLIGTGFDERWVILKDGGPHLRSVVQTATRSWQAVGDDGSCLVTTNGGDSWLVRTGFDSRDLRTIALDTTRRSRNLVAAGSGGALLSTNLGQTWRLITHANVNQSNIVWTGSSLTGSNGLVLAGLAGNRGIIVRQNGTDSYTVAATGAALHGLANGTFTPSGVGATERTLLIAVGDGGTILVSSDLGTNWTSSPVSGSPKNRLLGCALSDTGIGLAVGENGIILRRNFASSQVTGWTQLTGGSSKEDLTAVSIDGSIAVIVGSGGRVLRSTDAGLTWNSEELPGGGPNFAVFTDQNQAFTLGAYGLIQHRPAALPTGPLLTVSSTAVDFGFLPPGGTRRQVVEIFNRGGATLNLTNLGISGAGFTFAPTAPATLAPGASRSLQVNFTSSTLGQSSGELILRSDDPDGTHRIALSGGIRSNLWAKLSTAGSQSFADVQFLSTNIGYAISDRQVFKSVNGGVTWTAAGPAAPGPLRSLHFISSNIGWAVGGDSSLFSTKCEGDCRSTIWKTSDGGVTWVSQDSGIGVAITDIHMTSSLVGFVVSASEIRSAGSVLRTTDGGTTWVPTGTRPAPASGTFSGTAVHAAGSTVFAAGSGHLFRSADNGATWTRVLDLPAGASVNDIEFVGSAGWIAGNGGFLRFTANGGTNAAAWRTASFPSSVSDLQFTKVDFQLTTTGRLVGSRADGSSVIFHSANAGTNWVEELQEPSGSSTVRSVAVLNSSFAIAVGTSGTTWKLARFNPAPQGTPVLPARVDLPDVPLGVSRTVTVGISNPGPGSLNVARIDLEGDDSVADITLQSAAPLTIGPGGLANLSLSILPKRLGRQRAVLLLATDGFGGNSRCDISVDVADNPTTILFESQPPGLLLTLNGSNVTAPVTRGVVRESPQPGQWVLNSTNRIEAPLTQTNAGVVWRFQRWEPTEDRSFDYVALESPASFRAVYVAITTTNSTGTSAAKSLTRGDGTGSGRGLARAAVTPSFDPPTGPYLRLSDASLNIPSVGDLQVRGGMFMSADRITAALESGGFRLPENPAQGGILEVGAGSWSFEFVRASRLRLVAHGPDLAILDAPVLPPSDLDLNFKTDGSGSFTASFQTREPLGIVNGLFEIGPGSVSLDRSRNIALTVNGEARALRRPDGDFSIRQPVNFRISDEPFTFALTNLPATLVDLGAVKVTRRDAASGLFLTRNSAGTFSAAISNLNFSLFGATPTLATANAGSDGKLTLQIGGSIPLGPFSLQHASQSSRATLAWNFRNGSMQFSTPDMLLKATGISEWPSAGVPVPGFAFDSSGDFNHTLLLPDMSFDGIELRGATDPARHFIQLKRQAQKMSVQLRDERSFLGNTMRLGFDLKQTTAGNNATAFAVSGFFQGTIALQDTPVLGDITLGYVNLSYDSSRTDFQFQGQVETPIADFSVKFGSGGGQVCHLYCDDTGCDPGLFCLP